MALTLSELVEAVAKYEDRLTGSDHDKAAFARNIDLLRGRVAAVGVAVQSFAALAEPTAAPAFNPEDLKSPIGVVDPYKVERYTGTVTVYGGREGTSTKTYENGVVTLVVSPLVDIYTQRGGIPEGSTLLGTDTADQVARNLASKA